MSWDENRRVNLVVAHPLEARPLIELFGLEQCEQVKNYKTYTDAKNITLIVTGMGKLSAQKAVQFLGEMGKEPGNKSAAWLNIGIAGHQSVAIGEGLLAHKLVEQETGQCAYPAMLLTGYSTTTVITVDEPENNYAKKAAYEMEAWGFWVSAIKHTAMELVQIFKIISDNPTSPTHKVDAQLVQRVMAEQLDTIGRLVSQLADLVEEHNVATSVPKEFELLLVANKYSVTQKLQLKRLCQRYIALGLESRLQDLSRQSYRSSRELINILDSDLDSDPENHLQSS